MIADTTTPHGRARPPRAAGWAVHAFTASGAVVGLLALIAAVNRDFRTASLWMIAATAIDAADGVLARAARVKETVPHVDGARLDDIVDYVTYVFVPAFVVWQANLVPPGLALPVAGAMLMSSAFGFSRTDAKTADMFFTGFPSYWNIVVIYLLPGVLPQAASAAAIVALAALVFVPVGFVYPSRTPHLRRVTVGLGVVWAAQVLWFVWQWPHVSRAWWTASLLYPAYYVTLSLWLHRARRPAGRI